jgi:hypothetical protein
MGLDVAETFFDSQVEFADNSIIAYVRKVDTTSEKFSMGKLAALNLAALRVLVIATGGFVATSAGAVDYRIGDLGVSRESAVRLAIEFAVKSYESKYLEMLYKLTAGAENIDSGDEVKSRYEESESEW